MNTYREMLRSILSLNFFSVTVAIGCLLGTAGVAAGTSPRERISLDAQWRFIKGDPDGISNQLAYANIKPWVEATGKEFTTNAALQAITRPPGNPGGGADIAYARADFDDRSWRLLNLPHDWGIEGPFKQEYPGDTGKLPWWGVAWYRKHLDVPASDAGKKIFLDVDGAMAYATVWCNGQFVGGWPYGYASWRVELTPYLKFGGPNVIAIRLDNPPDSSRWYPGGGIYRNVWLVKTAPIHVAHWGSYITTPLVGADAARVRAKTRVENQTAQNAALTVETKVYPLDNRGEKIGDAVAENSTTLDLPANTDGVCQVDLTVPDPKLWSLEHPYLYAAVTTVSQNGEILDQVEKPFGIRTIEFTATDGFLLNGRRVPINGVCDHHDLGALGAAINLRALQRQIEILKAMGCNAIRTSHNPPAPELLDLCDRLGMLVMDESFDCWERGKTKNDYHLLFDDWHEKDWRAELRRDRNHPSIILWSIGNEIPEQVERSKFWIARELTAIAHEEDPTRPVTAACNHTEAGYNGFQNIVDVFGYNYKPWEYGKFRQANPTKPLFGSETASCISSRGEYFFPVTTNKAGGEADFQMSSYDLYAPPWATPPDWEFAGEDRNPFVAGEFVWTGFDYLGEPTPYNHDSRRMLPFTNPELKARAQKQLEEFGKILVPSRSSYFGIVDLAGFPKDRYYLYQARWRPDFPMAHLVPQCWNWPDRVGQTTPVFVYTSGDSAELFLNGKSLGKKTKGPFEYRLEWNDVKYEPGTLQVVAYKNGRRWATDTVKTTGPAAELLLKPDRDDIAADGQDLSFVTVTVADAQGWQVPHADNLIHFAVTGPGEIVATDNGDATSFESFQAPEHKAFNGLALVIVRAKAGEPGIITLTATSDGLRTGTVQIRSH
ncbi:MAG TPA: beta-galactosidase GalB [Verrucomicrobiae bacterium]|nr:beta-galactosidase GalB [Verrucomicrobiae bacterium]